MSTTQEIKRTQTGRVVSSKMDKSVTVLLERQIKHALYGKYIKRSTKVRAHDEENSCNEGDKVIIAECRPLSKTKSWRVIEILERAQ
ncbi:MAG: 30S ribosomal protein S17 [Gammaproteobacteria bacterium]|nr:30S ribosomal protein S17 [Gammaproteobacteria bacterium]